METLTKHNRVAARPKQSKPNPRSRRPLTLLHSRATRVLVADKPQHGFVAENDTVNGYTDDSDTS